MANPQSCFKQTQSALTSWLVSLSVVLAPLAGLPQAQAQEAVDGQLTESQKETIAVTNDTYALLDRAYYPGVPRRGLTGAPTRAEVEAIKARLNSVHQKYASMFENQVATTLNEDAEVELMTELNLYFEAAQKYETLKIVMNEPSDASTWPAQYGLRIEVSPLSQMKFLMNAGFYSSNFAKLENSSLDFEALGEALTTQSSTRSKIEIENGKMFVRFDLYPYFVDAAERFAMTQNPNFSNVLKLAMHWTATQLYIAQAYNFMLLRLPMDQLPEPSAYQKEKFVSLRSIRKQFLDLDRAAYYSRLKPKIFTLILNAFDEANRNGTGSIYDIGFIRTFNQLNGLQKEEIEVQADLATARKEELNTFGLTLASLFNLMSMDHIDQDLEMLIRESKRISGQWWHIGSFTNTDAQTRVNEQIAIRSANVAKQVLADGKLVAAIQNAMKQVKLIDVRHLERLAFQKKMTEAAKKLKSYENDEISLAYLVASRMPEINALQPSQLVSTLVDGLAKADAYTTGYTAYKKFLLTYLQGFTSRTKIQNFTLSEIFSRKGSIIWTPENMKNELSAQQIAVLKAGEQARYKDLNDLIALGQMLKFDIYETIGDGVQATPTNLKLAEPNILYNLPFIGGGFGSEKTKYLEEIRKDTFDHAPVMAAKVNYNGQDMELWRLLADNSANDTVKYRMTDEKLSALGTQIYENQTNLEKQMHFFYESTTGGLEAANEDLRTLVIRASQISVSIQQFKGFTAYFDQVKERLMAPGYIRDQWAKFSTWSNQAFLYIAGLLIFQAVAGPARAAGGISKALGETLTSVFGKNYMRTIGWFMNGVILVSLSDSFARGFIFESQRRDLLEKFFACGGDGPCVATYSDVSRQSMVMQASRTEFALTAAITAAVYVGFIAAGGVFGKLLIKAPRRQANFLKEQTDTLNMGETAGFGKTELENALSTRVAEMKNIYADPMGQELGRVLAREAHARIEIQVAEQAIKWSKIDARFAREIDALQLSSRGWKDLENLKFARENLKERFKNGEISSAEFNKLMHSLQTMENTVAPAIAEAEANVSVQRFLERVWNEQMDNSIAAFRDRVAYYKGRIHGDFAEFSGRPVSRVGQGQGPYVPGQNASLNSRLDAYAQRLKLLEEHNFNFTDSIGEDALARMAEAAKETL